MAPSQIVGLKFPPGSLSSETRRAPRGLPGASSVQLAGCRQGAQRTPTKPCMAHNGHPTSSCGGDTAGGLSQEQGQAVLLVHRRYLAAAVPRSASSQRREQPV